MLRKEFSFIATNEGLPTYAITDNNSRFNINMRNESIDIPENANNITLSVEQASIWWISPNIFSSGTSQNNLLYITAPKPDNINQTVTLQIPQGLYDVDSLSNTITTLLENAGFKISPDPVLSVESDNSTQKIILRFNYANMIIDFTQNNTLRTVLGYDSIVLSNLATFPQNYFAQNTAQFSLIDSFYICSNFISSGLRVNDKIYPVIASVPITVSVGYQILYAPNNPTKINCDDLRGIKRNNYAVWITDQNFNPVNLDGYPTKIIFKLTYDIK
jgi:hypothetical protein